MAPLRAIIFAIPDRVRKPYAQLAGTRCGDAPGSEIGTSQCEHSGARGSLFARTEPDQPQDSAMWKAAYNRKFAKVLVERNQDALFGAGCLKHGFVARIHRPVTAPADIVTAGSQLSSRSAPNAGVEQQLHAVLGSITKGSMRS